MEYESPESVPAEWQVGDVILNRYEVRQKFEGGGMGMVYRVYHREWDMELAVKAPRADFFQTTEQKENFEREAETWVNLGLHPHIVSCYYVRRLGGIPRLFAEFVEGGTLDDWIRDGRLYEGEPNARTLRVLEIAIQIAWALSYAHEKGLVHQDVKPANILMMPDGTAKLTDFGLARARSKLESTKPSPLNPAGRTIWVEGAGMLTPEYASPEQFRGETVSSRSDGWSWALTVLEMMQGGRGWSDGRFGADALSDHYGQSVDADPIARILKEHLNLDPASRPANLKSSIASLAQIEKQMGRIFDRDCPEHIPLSPNSLNNLALSLLDLGHAQEALKSFTEAITLAPSHIEANFNRGLLLWRNPNLTDEQFTDGDCWSSTNPSGTALTAKQMYIMAMMHIESGDYCWAKDMLLRSLELEKLSDAEIALQNIDPSLLQEFSDETFNCSSSGVSAIEPSFDGLKVFTGNGASLNIWDYGTKECLLKLDGHTDMINSIAISSEADLAITGSSDKTVRAWNLNRNECSFVLEGHEQKVTSVAMATSVAHCVSGSADKTIRLWDLRVGECLRIFQGHLNTVDCVLLTSDGRKCYSTGKDGVRFWCTTTGNCTHSIQFEASTLRLTSDGQLLLAGSDRFLYLIDTNTGCLIRRMVHRGRTAVSTISPDGQWAISGGQCLQLWKLPEGRCIRTVSMVQDGIIYSRVFPIEGSRWAFWAGKYPNYYLQLWSPSPGSPSPYMFCRPMNAHEQFKSNEHIKLFDPSPQFSLSDLEKEKKRRKSGRF